MATTVTYSVAISRISDNDSREAHVENVDSERILIGDGVRMPTGWDAVVTDEPNSVGAIRLHVVYAQQLRRSVAASVRVDRFWGE